MRLKSLKLAGFKSFANPTTFHFKHDVTAIVGPNGCGKSNVIDAIRWVLGETSAKQLRGSAMSDVIFAGVEGRAAKSLASVELIFEHTQDETHGIRHELNLYQELSLRRQVTKEGKSDYFINGQRVRRRDVVDVFLGTGLGSRSYAVIEQGMIGRIVESSPMQLREFIEEGAGVSRYQARRADTEKKLNETKENLTRLSDLQGELKRQHKTLVKQAQSAKEYQALSEELQQLHKADLMRRLFQTWRDYELKQNEKKHSAQELEKLQMQTNKVRQSLDELSAKVAESQWLKDDARDNYHNAQMAEQAAQHNFYTINSQVEQNIEKEQRLIEQRLQALQNIEKSKLDIEQLEKKLTELIPKTENLNDELQQAKIQLTQSEQIWQTNRDELAQLNVQKNALQNQYQLAQLQTQRTQQNQQKWQKKFAELTQLLENLTDSQEDKEKLRQHQDQLLTLKQKQETLQDDEQKAQFEALQQQIGQLVTDVQLLEKRHAVFLGEYEILHKLVHSPTHVPDSQNQNDDSALLLPILQDEICLTKLGQDYADVLDKFIGFYLNAKLTKDLPWYLIQQTSPEHTLFLSRKTANATSSLPKELQDNLIQIQALIESPKLHFFSQCYLYVGDMNDDKLKQLQEFDLSGVCIVTKTGWLIGSFGVMHINRFGEQGSQFLAQRQMHLERLTQLEAELDALESQLDDKKKNLKNQQAKQAALKTDLEERAAQKVSITTQIHQLEQAITKLDAKIQTDRIQQDNLQKNRQLLDEEKAEMDKDLQELQYQMMDLQKQLQQITPKVEDLNRQIQVLQANVDKKTEIVRQQQETYQAILLEQNTLTQNLTHAQRLLKMAQDNVATTEEQIADTKQQQQRLHEKIPELEMVFKSAKSKSYELQIISQEYEAATKVLQLEQAKLQEELTLAHGRFIQAQAATTQISSDVAVGESRMKDLADELMRLDNNVSLSTILADFRANPQQKFTDNSERQEQIKQQIGKLGAVNLAAAQELAELEERVSPMDEQIADIEQSMVKLQDAIKAIDEKTKSLFLSTLSAVNRELNTLFSKVFGGGQASLTLMEDETLSKSDKWRAGLVLMAQPKGKKNSRLAVLSGGEKTLTALSLIFAIFKQHPAPFCVLDEVDAPLDDANVSRFTSLIQELAETVQFIFISHNKLAMQTADELKGVTMPTAGISSLVTVDLQNVEEYLN